MALAGELAKYIGGELVKNTGKELATKTATSALSNLAPKIATKAGASMANKIGNELIAGSVLDKLVPTNRMLDKAGRPVTLYHSTPNNFDKFDDAMLGSNTGYDNTALGHFVTPDKDFSKRFIDIDNVGKTGRTMELQGNIQKPITHPYMAGYKYDNKDLDKIVEDYLLATDNPEFLDELRGYALDDNSNLYDEYMGLTMADSPFEVAGSDRQSLMNKGYDAVEIVEGPKSGLVEGSKDNTPVSSYAVFNGENLRPVKHIPINRVSNTEEVPVATLRKLFRGQKKGSDDLYYNKGDGTTGSATVGNGYYMTPNADKAEVWAGEGINPISIEANTKDILSKNELIEKTKWANDLINDEAYMSELWGKDPDMADFIENLSMGRLPEVSKYLDKPFIQPDSGQGEELAETIFFPDTRPELTQSIRNRLKEKSPKAGQSDIELSPKNDPNIRYATGLGRGSSGFDDSIERIGSEGIPATRKETLPDGWDILEKYLGGVDKRVENAIGKAKSKITKKDLVQFLDENDYDSEGTFSELWQRVKDAVNDMTTEELNYAGGGSAADIIQMRQRPDMNNIEDVYMGNKGHTERLDAEYSDRLGISKSTTPMSDKLSQPLEYAQGDYGSGVIGLDRTWSSGEAGVSNVAHERFHAWQEKSRGFDYPEEFKKAFEELEDEIIPLLHNKDEISKYWNGRNTDYYFDRNEQEARMVQDYLEYKNHTKRYMGGRRKYEYDERIIKPFDKFYAKLRELSKKGIAIPALAGVFGLGALANKKDDKSVDNIK